MAISNVSSIYRAEPPTAAMRSILREDAVEVPHRVACILRFLSVQRVEDTLTEDERFGQHLLLAELADVLDSTQENVPRD